MPAPQKLSAPSNARHLTESALADLAIAVKQWGTALGFDAVGISDTDLSEAEGHLQRWLASGYQGTMTYMARHGTKRSRPDALEPGTVRVISARMDYLPAHGVPPALVLDDTTLGYVSRYALGRDYHKVLRRRLQRLADRITEAIGPFGHRVFVDSAPVLEKALAERAGLGWIGKHSNLIQERTGSWFFLGEIYTDLPLPVDAPATDHCGTCQACIEVCPTRAIVAPYQVDARRCISYLTIELRGPIPETLRPLIGNRIYGCDDCQLVCPWNRFAQPAGETDFAPRHGLDAPQLVTLFGWDEETFLARTQGSAIRRIGHEAWLRNIAVALGNALRDAGAATAQQRAAMLAALRARSDNPSALVRDHVAWALAQDRAHRSPGATS